MPSIQLHVQSDSEIEILVISKGKSLQQSEDDEVQQVGEASSASTPVVTWVPNPEETAPPTPSGFPNSAGKYNLNEATASLIAGTTKIGKSVSATVAENRPYQAWHEVRALHGIGDVKMAALQKVFDIWPPKRSKMR